MSFKTQLLIEEIQISNKLLLESTCKGLNSEQELIVRNIYNEFVPLIEATLTPDQIKQIFTSTEQSATAAGTNRSGLGKAVDVAKLPVQAVQKVNDIINKAGQWVQNTKPVQAFDQKFEDLKAKISAKFPNLAQNLTQAGEWAKANPGKTAVIIGVLTAVASLAGGPMGGAIAGQILKGTAELMKGEKLSTAVGKGMKAAAVGWLAGQSMEGIGKMISSAYEHFNPIPIDASRNFYEVNIGNGLPSTYQDATFYGSKEQYSQFKGMWRDAVAKWQSGDFAGAETAFDQARQYAEQAGNETLNQIALNGDPAEKLAQLNQALTGLADAAQGAATGATGMNKQGQQNTQPQPTPESLTVSDIDKIFEHIENIYELHRIKTLSNVNEGVFDKLKQVGANLTTKITADKLMKAWQAAGSPTDSDAVAKILRDAGVDDSIITSTYQSMNIAPAASGSAQPATSASAPAASNSAQTLTVGQINKALATLKLRDLRSIQKLLNDTLAKKSQQPVTP